VRCWRNFADKCDEKFESRCKEDEVMKENKAEKRLVIFGKLMLLFAIFMQAWLTNKNYFNFINSDDAADLILPKMLAEKGGILSQNWHYSTELSVLNTQIIYSLLFRFISDFKMVRLLGQVIFSGILLVSYYFCLRGIDRLSSKTRFWKTAFLFIIPISDAWVYLTMKGYYVPYVAAAFVNLGISCRLLRPDLAVKWKTVLWIFGCLLAFLEGLSGVRCLQVIYLPMFLASIWVVWNKLDNSLWNLDAYGFGTHVQKEGEKRLPNICFAVCHFTTMIKEILPNICFLIVAFAGYLVNSNILCEKYNFYSYDSKKFSEIISAENIQNMLNQFLNVTGYQGGKEVISLNGVRNALSFVLAATIIYLTVKICRKMKCFPLVEQMVLSFTVLTFGINLLIISALGFGESRWIMNSMAFMMLWFLLLDKMPAARHGTILGIFYCILLFMGGIQYQIMLEDDSNEEMRGVYEFVTEHDYSYGYSTFWTGNWLTELTNGKFQTRCIKGDFNNQKLKIWHWLTPKQVVYRDEPILCILQKRRVENIPLPEKWKNVYEDENYVIYEIEDHREAEEYLENK